LPLLFLTTADSARVRHDFWKTVYELFSASYCAQISDWCREHRLAFTGHLMGEDTLGAQVHFGGGVMEHYRHMPIPGIDILTESIDDVLTCKQASSICNQFDTPVLLSETYGCIGYNLSFETQKWIGDWQMALGINFLCPHLSHYTLKGCAKRDYPPSFSYQSPWWWHYKHLADYQARICYVLRQGRPVRDILVIHPLTGAWCEFDPRLGDGQEFGTRESTRRLNSLMRCLLEEHRDFDLGDELTLAKHAAVDGDQFIVGNASYKLIIIPPTCNLESSTVELLEKYLQAGGKVLWALDDASLAHSSSAGKAFSLVDGVPSERIQALVREPKTCRASLGSPSLSEAVERLLPRGLSVRNADTRAEAHQVLAQWRAVGNSHVLFLANTDRENGVRLEVSMPGAGRWEEWDCSTGTVCSVAAQDERGRARVALELAPVASTVLRVSPTPSCVEADPASLLPSHAERLDPREGWEFRRLAPNSLVLDRCAYRLGDEPFSEPMFMVEAQNAWRARAGLPPFATLDRDVQLWKRLKDPAHSKPIAQLALRYTARVEEMPDDEIYLVLEDRPDFKIIVNGSRVDAPASGWFIDKSFMKVAIGNLLRQGSNTVELGTSLTPIRVVEDIYLIGEFAVDPVTFAIRREPRRLLRGDWCAQGYPFYTDGMMYRTQFQIPHELDGRVIIELDRFEGTVAALWVNGRKAAVLGWRPYRADVTEFVLAGANELEIEVVGSPRNLFGPRHSAEKYPRVVGSLELTEVVKPGYHLTAAGLLGAVQISCYGSPRPDLTTQRLSSVPSQTVAHGYAKSEPRLSGPAR
jgi:hypothetical protein